MTSVAVIGSSGFVGSEILQALATSGHYRAIPVTRSDNAAERISQADIVIHSANPAGRYQADQNPERDFNETVEKTAHFLHLSKGKRFVLISSISCRTQMDTAYGRHRKACELLALQSEGLVIRLGPMYGGKRINDSLHSILAGRPVYVSEETRYAYADVAWVARTIVSHLDTPGGIFELGASTTVRLGDLRDRYNSSSTFSGIDHTQFPEGYTKGPPAEAIYEFADREYARRAEWI